MSTLGLVLAVFGTAVNIKKPKNRCISSLVA